MRLGNSNKFRHSPCDLTGAVSEKHELLNAASRAARTSKSSYGFVLVVPSNVVHFRDVISLSK